ncbi:MAG: presenilin family intramembrane aspartyl protease [Candidatus Pacearchaeota archaeon]
MKHQLKIALFLVILFVLAQIAGLAVTLSYKRYYLGGEKVEVKETKENITKNLSITKEFIPEKVEIRSGFDVFQLVASFLIAIVIATVVFIILMNVGVIRFMRAWFFLIVVIGLFISFSLLFINFVFVKIKIGDYYFSIAEIIALILAIALAYYKTYKRDIIIHNITEIFVYPGIVILFLPLVNIIVVVVLLLLISIYDFIAVFKTKHMQKMAKFMIKDVRTFSGIMLPYLSREELKKIKRIDRRGKGMKVKVSLAVLGGGDIAFPMLLSSTALLSYGIISSIFIIVFAVISLFLLLLLGEKGKAYPALPPLAIGSLFGLLLSLIF